MRWTALWFATAAAAGAAAGALAFDARRRAGRSSRLVTVGIVTVTTAFVALFVVVIVWVNVCEGVRLDRF